MCIYIYIKGKCVFAKNIKHYDLRIGRTRGSFFFLVEEFEGLKLGVGIL